jgi:hypothetical protein
MNLPTVPIPSPVDFSQNAVTRRLKRQAEMSQAARALRSRKSGPVPSRPAQKT